MGILTEDMRQVVEAQLGFIATVCPDGTPNLSPKGTTAVWDDDHLVFADIRSPGTVANLRSNPSIEINVVDQLIRKGYRFKGTAVVHTDGELFAAEVMPEFVARDDEHQRWKAAVLAGDIVLDEVDTSPPALPRPMRAPIETTA